VLFKGSEMFRGGLAYRFDGGVTSFGALACIVTPQLIVAVCS
jgi:hypothetical protein